MLEPNQKPIGNQYKPHNPTFRSLEILGEELPLPKEGQGYNNQDLEMFLLSVVLADLVSHKQKYF